MKYVGKSIIRGDVVNYNFTADEMKTEKDCFRFAAVACGYGELEIVECRGYSDMDTHENYCSFKTQKDFVGGLDKVKKIDADVIEVRTKVDGSRVTISITPCWDNEAGNMVNVSGPEEAVKKVAAMIQKKNG